MAKAHAFGGYKFALIGMLLVMGMFAWQSSHTASSLPPIQNSLDADKSEVTEPVLATYAEDSTGPIREFQDDLANGGAAPKMVVLPAGQFEMGSNRQETGHVKNELPKHRVNISEPFAIGKYEVTEAEFQAFLRATSRDGARECEVYENYNWVIKNSADYVAGFSAQSAPAICVSWQEAGAYAEWLSDQTGHAYRLLDEAEWEYAARAGTTTAYSFGSSYDQGCAYMNGVDQSAMAEQPELIGAYCDDGYAEIAPVGALEPNAFGLHDMHGNVVEWTADIWTSSHADDAWTSDARTMKGGSWFSYPLWLRSANRNSLEPDRRRMDVGFRVARDLSIEERR